MQWIFHLYIPIPSPSTLTSGLEEKQNVLETRPKSMGLQEVEVGGVHVAVVYHRAVSFNQAPGQGTQNDCIKGQIYINGGCGNVGLLWQAWPAAQGPEGSESELQNFEPFHCLIRTSCCLYWFITLIGNTQPSSPNTMDRVWKRPTM